MAKQIEMFPTLTGAQLRDRALDQAAQHAGDWTDKAVLQSLFECERRHGEKMNGERLRHLVYAKIGPGPHPNTWGAIVRIVRTRFPGLLVRTGMETPKDLASHASPKPTYVINAHWRHP